METKHSKVWDVKVHKHGLGRVKQTLKHRSRRICLEIQRKVIDEENESSETEYTFERDLDFNDIVLLTVLDKVSSDEITDDTEVSQDSWVTKYSARVQDLEVVEQRKTICKLTFFSKKLSKNQDFIFSSIDDARSFAIAIKQAKASIAKRTHKKIEDLNVLKRSTKTFQLDILSASDLRAVNSLKGNSDPFCRLRIGERIVYKTKTISDTVNPIWSDYIESPHTTFSATFEEIFSHGFTFEVFDKEKVLENKCLGRAYLTFEDVEQSYNEIMELELVQDKTKYKQQGKLMIRYIQPDLTENITPSEEETINPNLEESEVQPETPIDASDLKKEEPVVEDFIELAWVVSSADNIVTTSLKKIAIELESSEGDELDIVSLLGNNVMDAELPNDSIIWVHFHFAKVYVSKYTPEKERWTSFKRFLLNDVVVVKQEGNKVTLNFLVNNDTANHDYLFETIDQAVDFSQTLADLKRKHYSKFDELLKAEYTLSGKREIYLLEVIAAFDLREANQLQKNADPYCIIRIGEREIHRTKKKLHTTDPIWTCLNQSFTLLATTAEELTTLGITFELYDWELVLKETSLGYAQLYRKKIHANLNKVIKLTLRTINTRHNNTGELWVKIREASQDDIDFMQKGKKFFHDRLAVDICMDSPMSIRAPRKLKNTNAFKTTKLVNKKRGQNDEILRRVTPFPDPDPSFSKTTKWMTTEDIEMHSLQPSKFWVHAGYGDLGYLFIEIIGCHDLKGTVIANAVDKIDPFVELVYGDDAVCTEVVKNCKNPKFMPWTRRAYVFNIEHIQDHLYLGVFDCAKTGNDHMLGRVSIDLHHFRPCTEYFLHYNLSDSAQFTPRGSKGRITVRLSIELNERKATLDALKPYPEYVFNAEQLNTIQVVKRTVEGLPSITNGKESSIMSYLDEIAFYVNRLFAIPKLITPTLLWRSSHSVNICNLFNIHIPLYSITLFLGGILAVERPTYIPALFTGFIGWIMLILLGMQRNNNSPWTTPRSYWEYLRIAYYGKSSPVTIEAINSEDDPEDENEGEKESELTKLKNRLAVNALYNATMADLVREEWEIKNEKTSTGLNVVSRLIYPIQATLLTIIRPLRLLTKVVTWERYEMSFFITTFAFLISFIFIFVPWAFLFQWIFRIIVWVSLGPWMKLVDIFKSQKTVDNKMTQQIALAQVRERVRMIKTSIEGEKAMKKYLFGEYSYSPPNGAYSDRYIDSPLASSSATPFPDGKVMFDDINIKKTIYGSRLNIDMLPKSVHLKEETPPPEEEMPPPEEEMPPPEEETVVRNETTFLGVQNTGQSYDAIPTEVV